MDLGWPSIHAANVGEDRHCLSKFFAIKADKGCVVKGLVGHVSKSAESQSLQENIKNP